MSELKVSLSPDFDIFREETIRLLPSYVAIASKVIRHMTEEELRQNAVSHPDGFFRMQIGPQKDFVSKGQVRLHFWVPGVRPSGQPHEHPWHLASRVLVGEYSEFQPNLVEDSAADLLKHRINYPQGIDQRAEVEIVNPDVTYRCDRNQLLVTDEGDDHFLAANKIHMSNPSGIGGITLAVMSPRFADSSSFYAPEGSEYVSELGNEAVDRVMDLINTVRKDF